MGFMDTLSPGAGSLLGGAAAAGGNLIGGIVGHILNNKASKEEWQANYNAQKEFAQNSIQWRVQDAQKAGIHPLYAMGNSPGYTPSSSMNNNSLQAGIAGAGEAMQMAMGQLQMANLMAQTKETEAKALGARVDAVKKAASLGVHNASVASNLGQTPKTLAPKKTKLTTNPRVEIVKGETAGAHNMKNLNDFQRYGDGWISYPNQELLDAIGDASIWNPMTWPLFKDAWDAWFNDNSRDFANAIESRIPGASKYGTVDYDRNLVSGFRPVFYMKWSKGTPKEIIDAYNALLDSRSKF